MNETIKPVRYEDSGKSQTFRLSELPEVTVTVRGVVYFADSDGFLALCDSLTEKRDNSYLCENAYLCDLDTFGELGTFAPESHVRANEAIMSALDTLRGIDLKALDRDI